MKNVIVKDVAEVFLTSLDDGKVYFFGITDTNNVNQSVDQEPITGGIGNRRVGTISSNKSMNFDVQTTLHDDDVYEIQSGSLFGNEAITLMKSETVKAIDDEGTITCAISGTPVGDVTVHDKHGAEKIGVYNMGEVTITDGSANEYYTIIYDEAEATANVLDLDSQTMPKTYETQLHTIAYDPDTEEVVADLYWQFYKARPDGNMAAAYSKGTNQNDSITFNCETLLGETSYGRYAVVPRV